MSLKNRSWLEKKFQQLRSSCLLTNSAEISGSKELIYQQVLRRFAHFNVMRLSTPAPLMELLLLALDEEERMGRWSESDGPKDQIAQVFSLFFQLRTLRETP